MQENDGYRSRCRWFGCVLICVRKNFFSTSDNRTQPLFQMDPADSDIRDLAELNAFWC